MTDDNLNGCNLSVLECRVLLERIDPFMAEHVPDRLFSPILKRVTKKLLHGARKELPKETRDRLESTIGSITLEEINDISD